MRCLCRNRNTLDFRWINLACRVHGIASAADDEPGFDELDSLVPPAHITRTKETSR
ncbi:hypothetical protein ACVDFE_02215 [Lentzea chajnantorensis]